MSLGINKVSIVGKQRPSRDSKAVIQVRASSTIDFLAGPLPFSDNEFVIRARSMVGRTLDEA